MDTKERTKLRKAINQLLDLAEQTVQPGAGIEKISGNGWQAWLYRPTGPGSETIHVELRVGEGWGDRQLAA